MFFYFYPNFLLQKPFAHGTKSRIKISAFLKSFAVFIFLLQKKKEKKVADLTTQYLLYHTHYDCVQTCKQPLSRHYIQEFGWESSLFYYICPEMVRIHLSLNVFYIQYFPSNSIRKHEYISLILNMAVVP